MFSKLLWQFLFCLPLKPPGLPLPYCVTWQYCPLAVSTSSSFFYLPFFSSSYPLPSLFLLLALETDLFKSPRLALNLRASSCDLINEITGLHHNAWITLFFFLSLSSFSSLPSSWIRLFESRNSVFHANSRQGRITYPVVLESELWPSPPFSSINHTGVLVILL